VKMDESTMINNNNSNNNKNNKVKKEKKEKKSKKEKKRKRKSTESHGENGVNNHIHKSQNNDEISSSRNKIARTDQSNHNVDTDSQLSDRQKTTISSKTTNTTTSNNTPKRNLDQENCTTTQISIEVQSKSDPSHDPVVVSFPSGLPSSLQSSHNNASSTTQANNNDNNNNTPTFSWKRNKDTSSRGRALLGADSTCHYTASNEGRGYDDRRTKLYVGIYDKISKTLKLVPSAERGTVFALEQYVTGYVEDGSDGDILNNNNDTYLTATQKRKLLFESFGSLKQKRKLKAEASNVVNMDSVVGSGDGMMAAMEDGTNNLSSSNMQAMEQIRNKGVNSKVDMVAKAYEQARKAFLPQYDPKAKAPHKVYDAQEIAGDDAWESIGKILEACIQREKQSKNSMTYKELLTYRGKWSPSTKNLLDNLIPDGTEVLTKKRGLKYQIKTLICLDLMVRFHNLVTNFPYILDKGSLSEISRMATIPKDVTERYLSIFTVPTKNKAGKDGFSITKQLKDKRLVHILILYLLSHGRDMKVGNIRGLCNDLKLGVKVAAGFLREAGFECKSQVGKSDDDEGLIMSVSLKVPLTFPPPKKRANRA